MIDDIKKICAKNLNCEVGDLSISKFYHGDGNPKQKVLFLVTDSGKNGTRASLRCIVKIRRNKADNARIRSEHDSCEEASLLKQKAFRIPKALFIGQVGEHTACGEEVFSGEVVSKGRALSLMDKVVDFQRSLVPYKKVSVSEIIKVLDSYDFSGDQLFLELKKVLIENKSKSLSCSFSHGDLTFRNILVGPAKDLPALIDWEYSHLRPIWGIDFVHYAVRAFGIKSYDEAVEAKSKIVAYMPEIENDFSVFVAMDRIFDLLAKSYNDGRALAIASLLRN